VSLWQRRSGVAGEWDASVPYPVYESVPAGLIHLLGKCYSVVPSAPLKCSADVRDSTMQW